MTYKPRAPILLLCAAFACGLAAIATAQPIRPLLAGIPSADGLFDDTSVHELRLQLNTGDWDTLKARYLENTYYPADFTWRGRTVHNVGIRSRGTGSRSPVKPGLKIAFDRYVGGQTFLGLSSVVLRNNTQDPSNMRERIAMHLFAQADLPASREVFARLYVNGEYLGLYTLVESIDDRLLARYFPASDGYLFSFDYPAGAEPFAFEDRGPDASRYVPQPFKPETHASDPRSEVLVALVQEVNAPEDGRLAERVGRYVDLSALVRQLAVEMFLADNDGLAGDWGMNNVYLYRLVDSTRFTVLPWDKSNVSVVGLTGSIWHNLEDGEEALRNRLLTRTLALPEYRRLYLDALEACSWLADATDADTQGTGGWMTREIAREYVQIREAVATDGKKPFSNDEFERAVIELRVFAAGRGQVVRDQVAAARGER